jgi:hypothetical protein
MAVTGQSLKRLYLTMLRFFKDSGGAYMCLDAFTSHDLLESLFDGRVIIVRDATGNIVSITNIWKIHEADLDAVAQGDKPNDVSTGNIVYIADHAGRGGYPAMIRKLKNEFAVGCWHHKQKSAEHFRIYRSAQ